MQATGPCVQAVAVGISTAPECGIVQPQHCVGEPAFAAAVTPGRLPDEKQSAVSAAASEACAAEPPLQSPALAQRADLASVTSDCQLCSSPIAALLQNPFTSSRPRRLIPDPLQPRTGPDTQRAAHSTRGTAHRNQYCESTDHAAGAHHSQRPAPQRPRSAPWTPAGARVRHTPDRALRTSGHEAVSPRYLDYRSEPRHCGRRRRSTGGDAPAAAAQTAPTRAAPCQAPRVASLPQRQRGEALAQTLGVRSFDMLQTELAAEACTPRCRRNLTCSLINKPLLLVLTALVSRRGPLRADYADGMHWACTAH